MRIVFPGDEDYPPVPRYEHGYLVSDRRKGERPIGIGPASPPGCRIDCGHGGVGLRCLTCGANLCPKCFWKHSHKN